MADDLEFSIDLSALTENLVATAEDIRASAASAVYEELERVMGRSKAEFVPVKDGVLRASGYVEQPVVDGGEISCTAGYGGPASAYARPQHEREDYHHTVGQAHYLSEPLADAIPGMAERLAASIAAGLSVKGNRG